MVVELEMVFPGLRGGSYHVTSPRTPDYNCIAWAAGELSAFWWPKWDPAEKPAHWPAGIPKEVTLDAFVTAFATLGYVAADSEALEPGQEKVALFARADGTPTHAARQPSNGRWTSKLGSAEDIEHALREIEGAIYGAVVRVLKRPVPLPPASA